MRSSVPVAVVILLVAAVLYVLGIGPAAWLMNYPVNYPGGSKLNVVGNAIEVIYYPSGMVAETNKTAGSVLDSNIELWTTGPLAPPRPRIQGNLTTLSAPSVAPLPATSVPAGTIPQATLPPNLRSPPAP